MFLSENLENEGKGKKRNWLCFTGIAVFPVLKLCNQSQPLWTVGGAGGEGCRCYSHTRDLARAWLQLPVWSRSAPHVSHSPGTACYSDDSLKFPDWQGEHASPLKVWNWNRLLILLPEQAIWPSPRSTWWERVLHSQLKGRCVDICPSISPNYPDG